MGPGRGSGTHLLHILLPTQKEILLPSAPGGTHGLQTAWQDPQTSQRGTGLAVKGPRRVGGPGAWSWVVRVVVSGNALSCLQPLGHQEEQTRVVRQFHFHGWPEIGIPAEGKGMIDLIAAVQKQQQQTGNHPITVHCR